MREREREKKEREGPLFRRRKGTRRKDPVFTPSDESSKQGKAYYNIGLATKWLRILSLGDIDKIRNHLIATTCTLY